MIEIELTGVNIELAKRKEDGAPVLIFTDQKSAIRVRVPLPGEAARAVGDGLIAADTGVTIARPKLVRE